MKRRSFNIIFPIEWFCSVIKSEISKRTFAPIVLIDTTDPNGGVYKYQQGNERIRHYNTISGLTEVVDINTGSFAERSILRVDPHYKAEFRGEYWELLGRLFTSVSRADTNGANKVFIY